VRYAYAMLRFFIYAGYCWLGLSGTAGFVAPAMFTSWFVPATRGALPSILCHVALVLAVCLADLARLEPAHAESEDRAASATRC